MHTARRSGCGACTPPLQKAAVVDLLTGKVTVSEAAPTQEKRPREGARLPAHFGIGARARVVYFRVNPRTGTRRPPPTVSITFLTGDRLCNQSIEWGNGIRFVRKDGWGPMFTPGTSKKASIGNSRVRVDPVDVVK